MLNQRSNTLHRRLHLERMEDRRLLSISSGLDAEALASLSLKVSRDWFETVTSAIVEDISDDTSAADGQIPGSNPAPVTCEMMWQGQTVEVAADQWIVQLTAEAANTAGSVGGTAGLFENTLFDTQVVRGLGIEGMILLETQTDVAATTIENWLANNSAVAYFEPNMVVSACATTPNDPDFDELWGMDNTGQNGGTVDADIDAPEAWDVTTGSSDIVVAVIDSGVDYNHPDLAANMWTNPGEIPENGIDDDGNGFIDDVHGYDFVNDLLGDYDPMDDFFHGTHVAGTIAAVGNNGIGVTGVCWSAEIMALKILDSYGNGTWANAVRSINYATMMCNYYDVDVRLTNNSYGGTGFDDPPNDYSSMYNAVAASGDAGILFVAAAGNDGNNNDGLYPQYPASFPLDNIISVAATDRNDDLAWFSNYGQVSVDLAAPGVDVYSTMPTVQTPAMAYYELSTNYEYLGGTSMAAPHVSGVVALVWSQYPSATGAQIRDAVLAGVDPIASLSGLVATGGRLNALGALDPLNIYIEGSPTVTKVEVGNASEMVEIETGADDNTQLIPADINYADRVKITFSRPIDDDNLDILRHSLAVYGRASGGWGAAIDVSLNVFDHKIVTWTFAGGPYKGGEMILRLADAIISDQVFSGGLALDGEWTSPENFEDNSGNSTFDGGNKSGDEVPGGDFVFSFTLPQTRPGDADCDGVVEEDDDAAILAANWLQAGAAIGWTEGDFNGDEYVNDVDATIMATNMDTTVWPDVTPTQSAPLAYDLIFITGVDETLCGLLLGHAQGRSAGVTYALVGNGPSHGSLAGGDVNADGTFTYTPNSQYCGIDTFTFKVNDGTDDSNTAMVTIYVGVSAPVVTCVTLSNSATEQEQAVDTAADGFDQLLPVALYDGIVDSTSYALAG